MGNSCDIFTQFDGVALFLGYAVMFVGGMVLFAFIGVFAWQYLLDIRLKMSLLTVDYRARLSEKMSSSGQASMDRGGAKTDVVTLGARRKPASTASRTPSSPPHIVGPTRK